MPTAQETVPVKAMERVRATASATVIKATQEKIVKRARADSTKPSRTKANFCARSATSLAWAAARDLARRTAINARTAGFTKTKKVALTSTNALRRKRVRAKINSV